MSDQVPIVVNNVYNVTVGNQATNCNIAINSPTFVASPVKKRQTRKRKCCEDNSPVKKVTEKMAKVTPVKKGGRQGTAPAATKNQKAKAVKTPKDVKATKKATPVRQPRAKKTKAMDDKDEEAKKPKATKKPAPKKAGQTRQPRKRKAQDDDVSLPPPSPAGNKADDLKGTKADDVVPSTSAKATNAQACDDQPDEKDPCPICYETPRHPFKLPCGHEFCFVCAKGLSESNLSCTGQCPMCRQSFSGDIFKHPRMQPQNQEAEKEVQGVIWYYEGNNGWWRFDGRDKEEIENAYGSGTEKTQMLICGNMYMIDFKNMVQYRRDGTGRVRRIKRESGSNGSSMYVKGVAGLVYNR